MSICKKYSSGSYIETRGIVEDALCEKPLFNKINEGSRFVINRPSFKSGIVNIKKGDVKIPINNRKGLGNYDITRNNFIAPPIKGREALNFERLQAQDIETGGIKVQLGDKTIEKLFKIQVEDPSDKEWIAEKNRRLNAGETPEQIEQTPPLGRPQRKISRMVNFGAQGLSIEDKIEQLNSAITQGHADSKKDVGELTANVALLLGNVGQLRNMTQSGFNQLNQLIRQMTVPKHWRAMGFTHRLFNLRQYREDAGLINLYILSNLSNLPGGRTFKEPLISYNEAGDIVGRTTFLNMVQNLGSKVRGNARVPGRYLDLETKAIIPFKAAVMLANSGVDNGQLNGQDPPSGPPNNGSWVENNTPAWDYPNNPPINAQGGVVVNVPSDDEDEDDDDDDDDDDDEKSN